jgi:hypothetical protein
MSTIKSRSAIFPEQHQGGWQDVIRRMFYRIKDTIRPPIDISDEYINWLYNINVGILVTGNLYCFDYAIRHLPSSAPILEIGSYCGLSTNVLSYYKARHGASNRLFSCDNWEFEEAVQDGTIGDSTISHQEYRRFAKDSYIRNTQFFSRDDLPVTVEMDSDSFFDAWRDAREVAHIHGGTIRLGGALSFCYIDGDHRYEQVRRDFINCDEFLETGGYILFDDSADGWGWEGVRRVVRGLSENKSYRLVIKNPNYLFQKI